MILYDEFDSGASSGSSPSTVAAPDVPLIHPEKMGELLERDDFKAMPYDKRVEWVNNVGAGIHEWMQQQPDANDETPDKFAEFMGATYAKVAKPKPQGVIGSFLTPITEDIVPNTLGAAVGVGAGIVTLPSAPFTAGAGPVLADIAASTGVTYGAKKAQNAIRGAPATQQAQELMVENQKATNR